LWACMQLLKDFLSPADDIKRADVTIDASA
jgi:hypothetical protein